MESLGLNRMEQKRSISSVKELEGMESEELPSIGLQIIFTLQTSSPMKHTLKFHGWMDPIEWFS